MRFYLRSAVVLAVVCCGAIPARAQWLGGVVDNCKQVFRTNNNWPRPYVYEDRASVAQPFLIMTNRGWMRQNLLSDYHFDEDSARLNLAGTLKVRSILREPNPDRRTIFLQRAIEPGLTAARLAAVQQTAARMLPPGRAPQVVESNMEDPGWPAEDIDNVNVQFNASTPVPRLPGRAATSSTSSTSGGMGGSGSGLGSGSGSGSSGSGS